MCYPSLSQEAEGFQLLVDSGSSKHFIDPESIREVESRMLEYAMIEPLMEIIAAENNVLRGTAKDTLLVVVRDTDGVLRTVKLPIMLIPGLKRNPFSSSAAAKEGVKITIEVCKWFTSRPWSLWCSVDTIGWHGLPRSDNFFRKENRICSLRNLRNKVWQEVCTNGRSPQGACSAVSRHHQR